MNLLFFFYYSTLLYSSTFIQYNEPKKAAVSGRQQYVKSGIDEK